METRLYKGNEVVPHLSLLLETLESRVLARERLVLLTNTLIHELVGLAQLLVLLQQSRLTLHVMQQKKNIINHRCKKNWQMKLNGDVSGRFEEI